MRLSENAHLLRSSYPLSLRRTSMYAAFFGIARALYLDIFNQSLRSLFFERRSCSFKNEAITKTKKSFELLFFWLLLKMEFYPCIEIGLFSIFITALN
jgi:hypothetical protein